MTGFRKAVKQAARLRLLLSGPTGTGKTYSALSVATALLADPRMTAGTNGRIALIDTEHGSAAKYAHLFDFDTIDLPDSSLPKPGFHPDNYIRCIQMAVEARYAALVIDSLSHEWNGSGGMLELVEQIAKLRYQSNTFRAWGEGTPMHSRFIEAILAAPLHVLATARAKSEYVMDDSKGGKAAPRKVGMAAIQRDGLDFEFDIVLQMTAENDGLVEKTRCPELAGGAVHLPGQQLARTLANWLAAGVDVADVADMAPPAAPARAAESAAESAAAEIADAEAAVAAKAAWQKTLDAPDPALPALAAAAPEAAREPDPIPPYADVKAATKDVLVHRALTKELGVKNMADKEAWLESFARVARVRGAAFDQSFVLRAITAMAGRTAEYRADHLKRWSGASLEGLPANGA